MAGHLAWLAVLFEIAVGLHVLRAQYIHRGVLLLVMRVLKRMICCEWPSWLVGCVNVPVNNFSVMSGRSRRFQGN